ncbi:MAG: type II toxin-antitoxin system RelE/ParE family toxin, partial [Bacteroidota bacterium]
MKIRSIHYNDGFALQFRALPLVIQKKALKAEQFFRANSFHPSLRLHKLKGDLDGLWSISIDRKYRIIFKALDNGIILFVSVGIH